MKIPDLSNARIIFEKALALAPTEREAFIRSQCADNPTLAELVYELLGGHDARKTADSPSHQPVFGANEQSGDSIGPYKLLEVIGEGGFGIVWLAERRQPFVQRVALKIIKPGMDTRAVVARFEQERQALAVMDHPNLAKVLDGGVTPLGRPYFVMELVAGESITSHCDRNKVSLPERLRLFITVCEAVQHAHQKGIIHRDIKPSNVLVSVKDGVAIPKIIDFGIAKAISRTLTDKTIFTEHGQIIGTPEYMSPEQAEMGATDIDTRTDVYSLGVLLYELLTGALPFDPKTLRSAGFAEIQRIIREEDPPRPSTRLSALGDSGLEIARRRSAKLEDLVRVLNRELEWVPIKAMHKDRTRRYRSATELSDDIGRYLDGKPLLAGPDALAYRLRKAIQRNKRLVLTGSLIALSLIAGAVASTIGFVRAAENARIARAEARASDATNQFLIDAMEKPAPGNAGPAVRMLDVLRAAESDVDLAFAADPVVRSRLHETYGRVYRTLGLHRDSLEHLNKAIAAAEQAPSADRARLESLTTMRDRASLDLGNLEEPALGLETDPANAAFALHDAGDYDGAEFFSRRALAAAEKTPLDAAAIRVQHVFLLVDVGATEIALKESAAALQTLRSADPVSQGTAFALLARGYALAAADQPREAAEALRSGRDLFTQAQQETDNPIVAQARLLLSGLIQDYGTTSTLSRPGEDVSPDATQLAGLETSLPVSLRNRARMMSRRGEFARSDSLFLESIAASKKLSGNSELIEAHTRRVWGEILFDANRMAEAERELSESLRLQRNTDSITEFARSPTLLSMARLRIAQGRPVEATKLIDEAVSLREKQFPANSWPIEVARAARGRALAAAGRNADARKVLQQAESVLRIEFGDEDERVRQIQVDLRNSGG